MFAKCYNPECESPFDYREGRLVRIAKDAPGGQPDENQLHIEHYWLCGKCAELFVFDYDAEMNVRIKPRNFEAVKKDKHYHFAAA
jgi:hypothetical protein